MRHAGIDFTLLDSDVDLTRFFLAPPLISRPHSALHLPLTDAFEHCLSKALGPGEWNDTNPSFTFTFAEPSRKHAAPLYDVTNGPMLVPPPPWSVTP